MTFDEFCSNDVITKSATALKLAPDDIAVTRLNSLQLPGNDIFNIIQNVGVNKNPWVSSIRKHDNQWKLNYGLMHCNLKSNPSIEFCLYINYSSDYGEIVVCLTKKGKVDSNNEVLETANTFKIIREFKRSLKKKSKLIKPPLLEGNLLSEILRNTVTFVRKAQKKKVCINRGILLHGSPGNGKSMVAAWIQQEGEKHGLGFQKITGKQIASGEFDNFADLNVIDDISINLMNRKLGGEACTNLLSTLNGVDKKGKAHAIIFTTNESVAEMEPAFKRSGRVDVILRLELPTPVLRQRMMLEYWPETLIKKVNEEGTLDYLVEETEGLSFADISGIGDTYLVNEFDGKELSSKEALKIFAEERDYINLASHKQKLGFGG